MRQFVIRDRTITDDSDAYVIAELSHNHNGSLALAREMVRIAADCGADAVKLQKRSPAFYDALRAKGDVEYADLRQKRELTESEYWNLKGYAQELGLDFIVTAFDLESLNFVMRVKPDAIKAASGALYNEPLIEAMAKARVPVILSTGCADMDSVTKAVAIATFFAGPKYVAALQCTSQYPTPSIDMNLLALRAYRLAMPQTIVGLSSHAKDNTFEPVAYAIGARIFEKHVTLSRHLGPGDHAMSLEPDGLKDLVRRLRETKVALGDGVKRFLPCEETARRRLDVTYSGKGE